MVMVNSFKDHYGKRGEVGSLVYHWHHDIGAVAGLSSTPEEKRAKAKRVVNIWTQGAAGTQIKLEGETGAARANNYVILEEIG